MSTETRWNAPVTDLVGVALPLPPLDDDGELTPTADSLAGIIDHDDEGGDIDDAASDGLDVLGVGLFADEELELGALGDDAEGPVAETSNDPTFMGRGGERGLLEDSDEPDDALGAVEAGLHGMYGERGEGESNDGGEEGTREDPADILSKSSAQAEDAAPMRLAELLEDEAWSELTFEKLEFRDAEAKKTSWLPRWAPQGSELRSSWCLERYAGAPSVLDNVGTSIVRCGAWTAWIDSSRSLRLSDDGGRTSQTLPGCSPATAISAVAGPAPSDEGIVVALYNRLAGGASIVWVRCCQPIESAAGEVIAELTAATMGAAVGDDAEDDDGDFRVDALTVEVRANGRPRISASGAFGCVRIFQVDS